MQNPTITRVRRVRVGHSSDAKGTTGVSVVVFDGAAPTVIDVRGGASCTYDTASLSLDATFGRRWAIFFAGGSVHGLDAARGIRTALEAAGAGHSAFTNPNRVVPISGATLFDLPATQVRLPDYLPLGRAAVAAASKGPVPEGAVGAATGATIGKYFGREQASRGSLGSAAHAACRGGSVGVLVVLNSVGAVRDPASGKWLAGARGPGGIVLPPPENFRGRAGPRPIPRGTTLVAVVTDVAVERSTLSRIATFAHAGLARAVDPVHSSTDGDVVFASTTTEPTGPTRERAPGETADSLGHLTARLVVDATRRAIQALST